MEGIFRFKSWFLNAPGLVTVGLIIGTLRYTKKLTLDFEYFIFTVNLFPKYIYQLGFQAVENTLK